MSKLEKSIPVKLKIVGCYLLVIGSLGVIWPYLGLGPNHEEFIAKSHTYKIGAYSRFMILNLIFLISGIGILLKKSWARKTAMVVLIISTIYTANDIAWGVSGSSPTRIIYLGSFIIVALWNGLWFYYLYNHNFESSGQNGQNRNGKQEGSGLNF